MNNRQRLACGHILRHYGQTKQEYQAVQELSELICVLTRRADQRGVGYKAQVVDEIADCEIMIEQLKQMHAVTDEEVAHRIAHKLQRQYARMREEKKECIPSDS